LPPKPLENLSAPISHNDIDSLIPQRKPGASASRTFAARPPLTAEVSSDWEEEEEIPAGQTVEFIPETKNGKPPRREKMTLSRLLFKAIGFVIFSAFGLAIGYVLLHFLKPETFKWPW
jgi:hypothetical protein